MERATGIEPVASAWKAEVLPLYEARAPDSIALPEGAGCLPRAQAVRPARLRALRAGSNVHRALIRALSAAVTQRLVIIVDVLSERARMLFLTRLSTAASTFEVFVVVHFTLLG